MTSPSAATTPHLPCHRCGYDLRAHPPDGVCPECGASVAESRRVAAVPLRPAWRDSDPRWRRRILAGVWLLVFLPLMDVLQATGLASRLEVPNVFGLRGAHTLDDSLLCNSGLYPPLVFCTGLVLLFSKERGRRRGRLDWTRRWGVLCGYVVLLLSTAERLLVGALVVLGIGAMFLAMPSNYQPRVTPLFVNVGAALTRYGPHPTVASVVVLVASSSLVMLLACASLYDALRASGRERRAMIVLAPLALFALLNLAHALRYWAGVAGMSPSYFFSHAVYFSPEPLVRWVARVPAGLGLSTPSPTDLFVEAAKWCSVLAIAVWLTAAQLGWGVKRNVDERPSVSVRPAADPGAQEGPKNGE